MADLTGLHAELCALLAKVAEHIFTDRFSTVEKGQDGLDLVTSVDFAAQAALEEALPRLLPGSQVVGEEGFAEATGSAPFWLVDPLDGTVNFVAGLPSYAIAVVLVESGTPVLAAVYDVPHKRTYSAVLGGGAFLDGTPLVPRPRVAKLAVASSGLLRDLTEQSPQTLGKLLQDFKLRNFGSQALHLCYAAAGNLSLVASREAKGWDDMAGALIAREAGLTYGAYHLPAQGRPKINADQFSLCAPAPLFENYAPLLALSQP